jgi:hypothetical protein
VKERSVLFIRAILGAVFIISAYTKFIAPGIVEIILTEHGIANSRGTAAVIVRLLIGLEFGIGLLFFQPYSFKKLVIPLSFLFLILFTGYLIFTGYILKDTQNCGCFGETIQMSPLESIIKNLVLIGLLLFLYINVKDKKTNLLIPVLIMLLTVGGVFIARPDTNSSGLKFSRYTNFTGAGRVDLLHGSKIIALLNPDCDHCREAAKTIAEMKTGFPGLPPVYALFFVEGETTPAKFNQITGSDFPYIQIGAREFFDLIGNSAPRLYLLYEGNIKEIWDDNFRTHLMELSRH